MLTLKSDTLTAQILARGAVLAGLWHKAYEHNLLVAPAVSGDVLADPFYCGAIVGPVANRITRGHISIGKETWQMEQNETPNCLHSGADGLHGLEWQAINKSDTQVDLSVELAHGANGLPGHRRITLSYALVEEDRLVVDITAQSDRDTVINIAHHPYWNLSGDETVATHSLEVFASHYLPTTPSSLPTGEIADVVGSDYDFRTARPIPTNLSLDGNLCLAEQRRPAPHPAARLTGPNGLILDIATTEPGLQVYNGSGMRDIGIPRDDGQKFCPFAGVALEPQGWPDAPTHSHFPSIKLASGDTYHQKTIYRIRQ